MMTGRCLCGAVRYELAAPIGPIVYCHCSMCRRASGSAFATNASVRKDAFRVTAGADSISRYESSPRWYRHFCSRCGSQLFATGDRAAIVRVRLGTLEGDPGGRPRANIWVGSKAPWHEPAAGLEAFDQMPREELLMPG